MTDFEKQLTQQASLWIIDGQLGIHYPVGEGFSEYFNEKEQAWLGSPWQTTDFLTTYKFIEFVDFV